MEHFNIKSQSIHTDDEFDCTESLGLSTPDQINVLCLDSVELDTKPTVKTMSDVVQGNKKVFQMDQGVRKRSWSEECSPSHKDSIYSRVEYYLDQVNLHVISPSPISRPVTLCQDFTSCIRVERIMSCGSDVSTKDSKESESQSAETKTILQLPSFLLKRNLSTEEQNKITPLKKQAKPRKPEHLRKCKTQLINFEEPPKATSHVVKKTLDFIEN